MPKGFSVRRPEALGLHATCVDIPSGADVYETLNEEASNADSLPFVIICGTGMLEKAVFRVPNDDAIPEIFDVKESFGAKIDLKGTMFEDVKKLPVVMLKTGIDLPDGYNKETSHPEFVAKPHWASIQTFEQPLALIYALGGRRREESKANIHFIVSGCASRSTGISESFVGQLLQGTIVRSPLQFVIGFSHTLSEATVQSWAITIEPGFEILGRLDVFLKAQQNIGKFFILATMGKLAEAEVSNIKKDGTVEIVTMPAEEGPYIIEGMSGIIGNNVDRLLIHAAIAHNCEDLPCESAGGRLIKGVVSSEGPLEIVLGEMTEERDIHDKTK